MADVHQALAKPFAADQPPATLTGCPVRSTWKLNPVYDWPIRRPRAQLTEVPAVAPGLRFQAAACHNEARCEVRWVTDALPLVTEKNYIPRSRGARSGKP